VKTPRQKYLVVGAVLAVALAYWWFFYVHSGASQTYPYVLGAWFPAPDPDLLS